MSNGISNFQIEQTIKNLNDDDMKYDIWKKWQMSLFDCKHRQLRQGRYRLVEYTWHWTKNWYIFLLFFWNWRAKKFYNTGRWKGLTLVNTNISMKACKKLTTEEINNLSDIARYFFNFVQSFGNKLRVHNFVNL